MEITAHYVVVDAFFADARALRRAFDARFGERVHPLHPKRFAWEYWHVPGQFAQHRAPARAVFPAPLISRFEARVLTWSSRTLGLSLLAGPPWVSFLLDGEFQGLHRDTPNGTFAFTFGLSRAGRPRYAGGETLLAKPELLDYWGRGGARPETAAEALFEEIPARFNRLVAFDARIPHAVRMVEGPRDPRDGRAAIQGWLRPSGCVVVAGSLDKDSADSVLRHALDAVLSRDIGAARGLCTVCIDVAPTGRAARASIVVDTLVSIAGDTRAPARARNAVLSRLAGARFPAPRRSARLLVPVEVTDNGAIL